MKAVFYEGNQKITVGACHPVEPQAGEVQIKVGYAGICGTDVHIRHGVMDDRVASPQVLGHEASGVVQKVGANVVGFQAGDRVTVMPLVSCHECEACKAGRSHICHTLKVIGLDLPGAFQSYWTVSAYTVHKIPDSLSLAHGALIEPLAVACHDVRMADVQAGDHVVVLGGGPIGMLVALVAQHAGADVLISEVNPFRVEFAQSLGLSTVNPMETDLVATVMARTGGSGADIVFEVSSSAAAAEVMTDLLRTHGLMVIVGIFGKLTPVNLFRVFLRELRLTGARVYQAEDFQEAIALAAAGSLPIDRLITAVLPMQEVNDAFEEIEAGGEVMKILLEVE